MLRDLEVNLTGSDLSERLREDAWAMSRRHSDQTFFAVTPALTKLPTRRGWKWVADECVLGVRGRWAEVVRDPDPLTVAC